ncbi:hypothetical protein [Micromonospora sp. D93]|uniref:hypothetical protein n=1 Tax=Micromonospora sp. D93 TaxID=2824886 RepID=UPI001B38F3F8|nr:hypothetical protein [Micromonospora sp. D93]
MLPTLHSSSMIESNWTLTDCGGEHAEDPFDATIRDLAEGTGHGPLRVDSRVIRTAELSIPRGPEHQNVSIFYLASTTGGRLRAEPAEPTWAHPRRRAPAPDDIGLALARSYSGRRPDPALRHIDMTVCGSSRCSFPQQRLGQFRWSGCFHFRSGRNAARISAEMSSGSSQATKRPPLSASLKYATPG